MERLFVFADIHGSLTGWLTALALMSEQDGLAVAGDLFDTRYGSYGSPDFRPDDIRSDLTALDRPFYYVYGNCDVSGFFPGYDTEMTFKVFGKTIYLHHGHRPVPQDLDADLVIQGHTHLCELEKRGKTIFMNPGSIVRPRNTLLSYGIIDPNGASIMALKTGKTLISIPFSP